MQYFYGNKYPVEVVRTRGINKNFDVHNHAGNYVISVVAAGSVEVSIRGHAKICGRYEAFNVLPLEPHAVKMEAESELVSLCVRKNFLEEHTFVHINMIIRNVLEEMRELRVIDEREQECFRRAILSLYRRGLAMRAGNPEQIEYLKNKIIDFPEEELTLNKMSEEAYISKYHLIRKFKNGIGLTPHQFQIQNRIRKAQHLLRNGDSIVEASLKMGFYDQSHFNKYFQKIVGISPTEYLASGQNMDNCR